MRFQVLGPLRVYDGTRWSAIRAGQQRVVLAVLLAEAGRMVSVDRLADEIWGERVPRAAAATVRGYVMQLRRMLGVGVAGPLVTRGRCYELAVDDGDVDAEVFAQLTAAGLRAAAAGEHALAAARLSQALALWRGPALADVPAAPTVAVEVARLEQHRLAAMEERLRVLGRLGRYADVVDEAGRLVAEHPLREVLWTQLMLGLYRCGRRAEALQAYQRARRTLLDALGAEPGPQLRELEYAIRTEDPRLAAAAGPGLVVTPRVIPAQLPPDTAGFTGRQADLRQLDTHLPEADAVGLVEPPGRDPSRLLVISTIAGTAGVGKTALAVHWAHQVRDRFPDGQLYINLRGYAAGEPLRPIDALAVFLPALGIPADELPARVEPASALYRSALAGKRMLVLLDNARSADQVRPLLPASPGCLVVVTSRDQLRGLVARDGAVPLTLGVLTPPEAHTLLRRLLGHERVRTEPDAIADLAGLCGHLPLALRIAAANLIAHPQQRIADYASKLAASDRLAALQVGGDPHSAVRSAFDHSYAALAAEERRLFRLLGLVPGAGITSSAAAALADIPAEDAGRLLDQLVAAHLIDEHRPGRYGFHDLLRQYAANQAMTEDPYADRAAAVGRLYEHYLSWVDAAAKRLYPHILRLPLPASDTGPAPPCFDDVQASGWLDTERSDLVAAITNTGPHVPRTAVWQLSDALRGYLYLAMQTVDWQVVAQCGLAAAEAAGDPQAEAAAHLSIALLHWSQNRYHQAIDACTTALALARRAGWAAGEAALNKIGAVHWTRGNLEEAADHYAKALRRDRHPRWLAGHATKHGNLGAAFQSLGRLQRAADHHAEALALYRKAGSRGGEARTLARLGDLNHALGRCEDADAYLSQAVARAREIGARHIEAAAARALAAVRRDTGCHREALNLAQTAVSLARDTGDRDTEAQALTTRATIHHQADHQQAIDDHQHALRLARDIDNRYVEAEALIGLATAEHHAGHLDRANHHIDQAMAISRRDNYRVLEGNALTTLAAIELAQGDLAQAIDDVRRALGVHTETGHRIGQAHAHLVAHHALRAAGEDHAAGSHHDAACTLFAAAGAQAPDSCGPQRSDQACQSFIQLT